MSSSLPEADHVARYCPPARIDHGQLQASAFRIRRNKEEKYLSVNWLEKLHSSDRHEQIKLLQDVFGRKMRSISAAAEFAVLHVGTFRRVVTDGWPESPPLDVLHVPEPEDPSHAGIFGIHEQDDQVVSELLLEAVQERYLARRN